MLSALDLTLGALEVGTWLSVFLYGIITLQVYIYIQVEFKDHVVIRLLVISMWVLDTIHTILLCVWIYHMTVADFGQPQLLDQIRWDLLCVMFINGVMATAVQSFFAYRIRLISGQWIISAVSWTVCAARMGIITTVVTLGTHVDTLPEYIQIYEWTVPTAMSILCFGDLLNTSALCFFLFQKRKTAIRNKRLLNKLIVWAVETGLITTVCGILVLILSITMESSLTWLAVYIFFPKFYSISLLTSLNNRPYLRRLGSGLVGNGTLASTVQFSVSRRDTMHVEMVPASSGEESGESADAAQKSTIECQ